MQLYFGIKKRILQILTVLLAAVVLLLFVFLGWSSGKYFAQSGIVFKNALAVAESLDYFLKDQDRYPSALEFQDRNIMMNYFNNFPPFNFVSKNCQQSYLYKRAKLTEYSLAYCLERAVKGQKKGWNQIKNPF